SLKLGAGSGLWVSFQKRKAAAHCFAPALSSGGRRAFSVVSIAIYAWDRLRRPAARLCYPFT
ncbi:MAG: hypothetical protein PHS17_18845, partial [Desulfobacterales bacterium]|nr:hypothetical protein [Desulfobacterales bacterium]